MENNETTPKSIPEVEDKELHIIPTTPEIKSYITLASERGVIINLLMAHKPQDNNHTRKITAVATEIINDCLGESFLECFLEKEKEIGSHNIRVTAEFGNDCQTFDICIDELNYDEFKVVLDLKFLESMTHMLFVTAKTHFSMLNKEGT